MKRFIFFVAVFLAGTIGTFGTLAAVCGPLPAESCSLNHINTAPEILLLIFTVAVMAYGLVQCIRDLKKDK